MCILFLVMNSDAKKGGVIHISPVTWGEVHFALRWVRREWGEEAHGIWISESAWLSPTAIAQEFPVLLSQFLIVRTRTAAESWALALESSETGLFDWVMARPSQVCRDVHLRRLQLTCEKSGTQLLLVGKLKLPHWTLKQTIQVDGDQIHGEKTHAANPLLSRHQPPFVFGRSLPSPHSQSQLRRQQAGLS